MYVRSAVEFQVARDGPFVLAQVHPSGILCVGVGVVVSVVVLAYSPLPAPLAGRRFVTDFGG